MKRRPTEVYFVGDSPVDIEAGTNAGMNSIAVTWGYRERDQLQQADPNYMVDNAEALRLLLRDTIAR